MRLSPDQRLGLAVLGLAHGIFLVAVAGIQMLPRALSPVSQLCADSPTPGLCALAHGRAMAAGRPGRREGDNSGGGSGTASTAGVGGLRLCREHPEQCDVWSLDLAYVPARCEVYVSAPRATWPQESCAAPAEPREKTAPAVPPPPSDQPSPSRPGDHGPGLPPRCPPWKDPPPGLLPAHLARALRYFDYGCGSQKEDPREVDLDGCFNAAVLLERVDPPRALGYHARGCALGDGESCERAATLRARGALPAAEIREPGERPQVPRRGPGIGAPVDLDLRPRGGCGWAR